VTGSWSYTTGAKFPPHKGEEEPGGVIARGWLHIDYIWDHYCEKGPGEGGILFIYVLKGLTKGSERGKKGPKKTRRLGNLRQSARRGGKEGTSANRSGVVKTQYLAFSGNPSWGVERTLESRRNWFGIKGGITDGQ